MQPRLRNARLTDSTADLRPPERAAAWARAFAVLLCCLALLAAARGLVRHNTWYLASDQFAFLTFADDLAEGRLFHDTATVALLTNPTLPPDTAVDAYYQTYILREGRLYSRYPPGYPLLLAGAKLVGGEAAQHWLNPLLYLTLTCVLGLIAARLTPVAPWAAAATTMWAVLVIPAEVHYWGITIARDLPAHLLAMLAFLAAHSAAAVRSGLLLGLAATVRPDAVLWGIPAARAFPPESRTFGAFVRGGLAFAVGVLPLFAYNTVTQGHPLAFTQGSEFQAVLESAAGGTALLLAGASFVSGGAFRLVHFPATFPVHVRYLVTSFGGFLWLAVGMVLFASVRRLRLARALGSYVVIGLLFYSCWSHGDPRYLVGVSLSLIVLAAVTLVRVAGWLADGNVGVWRRLLGLLAVGGVLACAALLPRDPARGSTTLERASAGSLALAMAASIGGTRVLAPVLPAIAFATIGVLRIVASGEPSENFRAVDVARARTAIEALVPRGALVLTSPALGRPAENWTYYTHTDTHYLGELPRLFSDANQVAFRCSNLGRPFYLLLAASERFPLTVPAPFLQVHEVARRQGEAVREWFVDVNRVPGEVVLYEAKISLTPPGS